jgi:uncharacterized protein (DUF433 family)
MTSVAMEFDLFRERRSSHWVKGGGSAKGNSWFDSAIENYKPDPQFDISGVEYARGVLMNIKDVVNVNPNRMSGAPCFTGTRVPITHLFEYLETGETVDEFLRQFPSVTRAQALAVLELSKESLLANYEIAA